VRIEHVLGLFTLQSESANRQISWPCNLECTLIYYFGLLALKSVNNASHYVMQNIDAECIEYWEQHNTSAK